MLKKNRLRQNIKFRRQRPIGNYIVDFVSIDLKLVIEADGITHTYGVVTQRDQDKDNYLSSLGYKVLRYSDEEILTSINRVIENIDNTIKELQNRPQVTK